MLTVFRMKPAGIFTNANVFGIMMIFAAPFWIAAAVWSKNTILRIIAGILALILSVSIILTNSRSAIVGLLFSVIFYFAVAKKLKYFLSIIAILSVILLSSPLFRIVTSVGLRVERAGTGRVEIWKDTLELIKQNAIFGVGAGNFPEAYRPYFESAFEKGFMKNISHSHNEVLHLFVELGIMGLVLILVLYYIPLKRGFALLKRPLSDFDRIILYGSMGILFANLGNSFFDANTMLADGGLFRPILYWITVIVVLKMYQKYSADNYA
ncbi:MAG: O-antigen ligase family protein [Candidatus Zixiibacteriota bacterium]|nr:MAG: O-antigen ligase family protein [candidate division Zixibacteria bacterium]